MTMEHNGETYKAEFLDDGRIAYYKEVDGKWVLQEIEDIEPKECATCAYYDTDRLDPPCFGCHSYTNWEKQEDK